MKKLTILLLLAVLFLIPSPAFSAIKYVDFVSGDDSGGDGSTGNPYASIAKADDGLTGGDEVRVKKTTVQTASGTMTWTNASVTLNTTNDETGNISAGDAVCKTSDFTGTEGWWYVSAIDSSTITLVAKYDGSTEAVTTYYLNDAATQNDSTLTSGSSTSSRFKITGGWDLTGPTRDGYTFMSPRGVSADTFTSNVPDYIEFSYFVLADSENNAIYQPLYFSGSTGSYIHHIYSAAYSGDMYLSLESSKFEDIITTGPLNFYSLNLSTFSLSQIKDIYIHPGAATIYGLVYVNAAKNCTFDNINLYDSTQHGLYITNDSHSNYFKDSTIDGCAQSGVHFYDGRNNVLYNCTITNNDYGVRFYYDSFNNRVHSSTFSGNATDDVKVETLYTYGVCKGSVITSAGVHTSYAAEADISSDTTDARSGTCIRVDPRNATYSVCPYTLGTVKVGSTATDLTLKIYMKDDAGFNGHVYLMAVQDGELVVERTEKTPTTSYVEYSIAVTSTDLTLNRYVDLMFLITGTAGNVFFDDFSWSQ
jgi:parallel beta-helix repeat protein